MCSFLVANWLILNLTQANFFLQPRGPDGTNRWQAYGWDFVHNLLHMTGDKVLQPFHDPDAEVVALFNGEIYNWQDLQRPGDHFRSDGDVLIREYLRSGPSFARRLDGEFALLLFDFARGRLVLATDPFGTKPLWLAQGAEGRFAVASYRSALERLLPDDGAAVQRIGPNSMLHFELGRPASEGTAPPASSGEPPKLVSRVATFEFDLRQHKRHTRDWRSAFLAAVRKRAQGRHRVALCLSDGYDTGAIALALGQLGVPHALYTVQAKEDVRVLAARVGYLENRSVAATLHLGRLSVSDFECERSFLAERAERVQYTLREGYANVDDKAAAGLSWVYRQAAERGHRLFLAGSGADETISDYGILGRPVEFHSTLRGIFPEDLSTVFPWLNFFMGTQLDYLSKEESTAGAHGVESRYPFLDRAVVQEYLWLAADLKNAVYKAPISELMEDAGYPFTPGSKRGFSADKNLAGDGAESTRSAGGDALLASARDRFWATAASAAVGEGGAVSTGEAAAERCESGSTILAVVRTSSASSTEKPLATAVEVPASAARRRRSPQACAGRWAGGPCTARLGLATLLALAGLGTAAGSGAESVTSSPWPSRQATASAQPQPAGAAEAWLAQLSRLPGFAAAEAAEGQEELAPPLSVAAANGHRIRHQAVFMTSCMEQLYFWTYCAPFVSSFGAAFGREQGDGSVDLEHSIFIATVGVPEASVAHVHVRFPFARFFALDEHAEELSSHDDPTEAENYRRMSYQSLKLQQYIRIWQEEVINSDIGFVVCMDSDMLMVKSFNHVFEHLAQRRADVAFTYYDGKREVPWGTADELATTKGQGYVRLQGGMLVMRNAMEALHWFALWASLTQSMLSDVQAGVGQQERWQALYKEFKGPSQAALAFLLTQGQLEQMLSKEECCSSVRSVQLEALRKGGPDVEVRMLGIPARFLNDAESTEDGALPSSVHVVHLKGHWWRTVLPDGLEHIVVPTRSYEWNRQAFELWRRHHAEFAFAFTFEDSQEGEPPGGDEGRGEG